MLAKLTPIFLAILILPTPPSARAEDPSTQPAHVDVTKKDQITAAVDGLTVILAGVVESAQWNGPGKMLVIKFKGAPDNFQAVATAKQRPALDKAFNSDVTMTITGHPVEITGNLKRYEGKAAGRKGMIEITVAKPDKLKIMDAEKPAKPAK